ncbi:uncharacterized protein RCC_11489 [Ramularia collo-cygni]|uniref:Uncharacterized protein n=1 Tax=Ramularia collo-cygni TaxID=112498 RepID=A0A2D3VI29_9PEZI|nr:uncharacterized protein RCC_11489 [Ramularia collo-cygni]CZT25820.1 uncharacterized protein RCC_11489 [Ramularia collo-cygni]
MAGNAMRTVEEPIMDLTNMPHITKHPRDNTLRGPVYHALAKLLGFKPTLRQALEMRWILLLIIDTMRKLGDPAATDKDTWIEDISDLGEHGGGLRQATAEMIAAFFKNAPWGLHRQAPASSFEMVLTVNGIHAGVGEFSRRLAAELKQAEGRGVNLGMYDVGEAGSDTEGADDEMESEQRPTVTARKPKQQESAASKVSSAVQKRRKKQINKHVAGSGNHEHGRAIPWTTPEHMGLLELYRDNPDRKTVSHPRIAELHNARFWPKLGEGRTQAAVSQQYLKLVQHDLARIPAKLAELQALLEAERQTSI